MKRKHTLALLLTFLTGLLLSRASAPTAQAAFGSSDFLKANGSVIRRDWGGGSVVTLKGTNLGGWLLQEGWMSPLGPDTGDEYAMRSTLNNRFGASTATTLINGYHDNWIRASDLDNIKNLGFNMIRVPIHWEILMNRDGSMKPDAQAFRELDWVINEASARNIYVMLDLHGAPGAACPWQSCGQSNSNALWTNSTYQNWTVQIWERLATRYRGNATVAAYDLLNEPLLTNGEGENAQQVRQKFDFYDRMYKAVRAKDADHIIVVAAFYGWDKALPPWTYGWSNVVYQLHHYNFDTVNDWNITNNFIETALNDYATFIQQWNVPGFAGEYWFSDHYDLYEKWMSGLNALNVSWTSWTYKVTDGGNWGLYQHNSQPQANLNTDSAGTIAQRWTNFTTNFFQPNTQFQNTVRAYTPAGTKVGLRAVANNQYVCADDYGNDPLIANRGTRDGWETFTMITNPDGTVSFVSHANNKYITADLNNGGKLVARARGVLGWEKFRRINLGNGTYALQAVANNKYVSADLTVNGVLLANRNSIGGAWEAFVFETVN